MTPIDDDNPALTDDDLTQFRPAREVLPDEVMAAFNKKGGRPLATNPKVQVSIRLDQDLLAKLEADYPNWRSLINKTMRSKVLGKRREAA